MKVTREFFDNDIYQITALENGLVVINDDYCGISILDDKLSDIRKIYICDGIIFDRILKSSQSVLLVSSDTGTLFYVSSLDFSWKPIRFDQLTNTAFLPYYEWNDPFCVTMYSYKGDAYLINIKNGNIEKKNHNHVEKFPFKLDCPYCIENFQIYTSQLIIKRPDFLEIRKLQEPTENRFFYQPEQGTHFVDVFNDSVLEISENQAKISFQNQIQLEKPRSEFCFLKGEFLPMAERSCVLLAADKANALHNEITIVGF